MLTNGKKLVIAGPCAAESLEQVRIVAQQLKQLKVQGMRACLWKPRTKPGFEGVGSADGIGLLHQISKSGMIAATEVMLPSHAEELVEHLVHKHPRRKFIFWIGARNQNHMLQREIGRILANEDSVYLMIKNQMWRDQQHWLGIYGHVCASGFPAQRLLLCHRGFVPNGRNPRGLRNIPDYKMAMRVKKLTGGLMLLDPSHIGGVSTKVMDILKEAKQYNFDGYLIEVHSNPQDALTDAAQQLTIEQLAEVLEDIL